MPVGETSTLSWSPRGSTSTSNPCGTTSSRGIRAVTALRDRVLAGGDQPDDPRPVGDQVAPAADVADVLLRQRHRVDRGGLGVQPGLDDRAARADAVHRGRQPGCGPRALGDDVHAGTAGQVGDDIGEAFGRRVEHRARRRGSGERGPVGVRLGDDDGRGAERVGVQRREHADRPGTGDEHDVAAAHPDPVDAVRRDAGRLDDRALEVGDLVGQNGDLVLLEHGVLRQAAGLGARARCRRTARRGGPDHAGRRCSDRTRWPA